MRIEQKLSPKYWVVHSKLEDDVYLSSAHKSKHTSIERFVKEYISPLFSGDYEDALECFENDEDYECILIELKRVDLE